MSRIEFYRIDLQLIVRGSEDGGALVLVGWPGAYREVRLSRETVSAWLALPPGEIIPDLSQVVSLREALAASDKRDGAHLTVSTGIPLRRITVTILDTRFCNIPWEQSLAVDLVGSYWEQYPIIRTSLVRPRAYSISFTFPLRILHINPSVSNRVQEAVRRLLGTHLTNEEAAQVIQVYDCESTDFKGWIIPQDEPTAEILHFDRLPLPPEPGRLLSTAWPEQPGTLGWFDRVTDIWQTRLVIFNCRTEAEADAAQRLASALVNRGGPGVLVSNFDNPLDAENFYFNYNHWYHNLIHDFPLDLNLQETLRLANPRYTKCPSLFAGAGREEITRVSANAIGLLELNKEFGEAAKGISSQGAQEISSLVTRTITLRVEEAQAEPLTRAEAQNFVISGVESIAQTNLISNDQSLSSLGIQTDEQIRRLVATIITAPMGKRLMIGGARVIENVSSDWKVRDLIDTLADRGQFVPYELEESTERQSEISLQRVVSTLQELQDDWDSFKFEMHESEGIVPLSRKVNQLREHAAISRPSPYREAVAQPSAPRYINSSLSELTPDGSLQHFDQTASRLMVGEIYYLGIQIGPKDERVRMVGATALVEEVFKWTPEMTGVWLEVGVTGLDFDVVGDPVQEFWLPRGTPSDFIYFTVVPRVAGAARLRFCIYYQQNLIQSFRLAAISLEAGQKHPPLKRRKQLLAEALDITQKAAGNSGYLARLEYSLTSTAEGIESRPARDLSIIVNDLNGLSVITLKGPDTFRVVLPGNIADLVKKVRRVLKEVSANVVPGESDPSTWEYAFGPYALQPQTLTTSLQKLAEVGWNLYDQIIPADDQEKLDEILKTERRVIHVANVLRDKVIPWAALYDRQYSPNTTEDENLRPVAHDVCLAALPNPDGSLPTLECRTHEKCLLHPDRLRERELKNDPVLLDETVACPLHFLGFKHIIEIPPQQVDKPDEVHSQRDCILSGGNNFRLAAGFNAHLKLWSGHWTKLQGLTTWQANARRRSLLLKALKDENLDLIYLYCHALGGIEDESGREPQLLFQDEEQTEPEKIISSDLPRQPKWKHHPLIFLNGCGTVGFSPDALSPFLKKLVDDLGASGVIGTEVTVWEELATEAAIYFLEKFLSGLTAGDALLAMRRALLASKNPLGLVYTLYAPAHLMLDRDGDGRCQKIN